MPNFPPSPIIEITDLSAPELAVFAKLTERQLRSKIAPAQEVFIAESPKVIATALDAGCTPLALLMERRHLTGDAAPLLPRCPGVPIYTGGRAVLAQLTGYELTRGVLCALRRPALPTAEQVCAGATRLAVLEGVVDSTNMGAMFRSAAALGMGGVLVGPTCCDPLCRRALRVSMGTVLQLPWARLGPDCAAPGSIPALLRRLGFATAAMALRPAALPPDAPVLTAAPRLAVLLGAEGDGLPPATVDACDYTVCIPMQHGVDSLNVAAAAAVAFWCLRGG